MTGALNVLLWGETGLRFSRRLMSTGLERTSLHLKPCKHQVAGHLFEDGKAGSLVDDSGHFYKPQQAGPRGRREREFYEIVQAELRAEKADSNDSTGSEEASVSGRGLDDCSNCQQHQQRFSVRNATLLRVIPRYYGLVENHTALADGKVDVDGRCLLELEDVAKQYRRPSIIDIKVGYQTWYPGADARYIDKCKIKDASTTQSRLGFKICGMQVYRHCQRGYWRASKRWCKKLAMDTVDKALVRFANNEAGLRPVDVYGGPGGAIQQLQQLEAWFQKQREFYFYSSSILIIYEGDTDTAEEANVTTRLVDFAHTFRSDGQQDTNFLVGVRAIISALSHVMQLDYVDAML